MKLPAKFIALLCSFFMLLPLETYAKKIEPLGNPHAIGRVLGHMFRKYPELRIFNGIIAIIFIYICIHNYNEDKKRWEKWRSKKTTKKQ